MNPFNRTTEFHSYAQAIINNIPGYQKKATPFVRPHAFITQSLEMFKDLNESRKKIAKIASSNANNASKFSMFNEATSAEEIARCVNEVNNV